MLASRGCGGSSRSCPQPHMARTFLRSSRSRFREALPAARPQTPAQKCHQSTQASVERSLDGRLGRQGGDRKKVRGWGCGVTLVM